MMPRTDIFDNFIKRVQKKENGQFVMHKLTKKGNRSLNYYFKKTNFIKKTVQNNSAYKRLNYYIVRYFLDHRNPLKSSPKCNQIIY